MSIAARTLWMWAGKCVFEHVCSPQRVGLCRHASKGVPCDDHCRGRNGMLSVRVADCVFRIHLRPTRTESAPSELSSHLVV
jgi:hypothetical protein